MHLSSLRNEAHSCFAFPLLFASSFQSPCMVLGACCVRRECGHTLPPFGLVRKPWPPSPRSAFRPASSVRLLIDPIGRPQPCTLHPTGEPRMGAPNSARRPCALPGPLALALSRSRSPLGSPLPAALREYPCHSAARAREISSSRNGERENQNPSQILLLLVLHALQKRPCPSPSVCIAGALPAISRALPFPCAHLGASGHVLFPLTRPKPLFAR